MKNILFVALALFFQRCDNSTYTTPQVKPLVEAVYASGFVVSDQEYQVFSQVDGTLQKILVREGEEIKRDQPLLLIESNQQNARYTVARDAYDMARKNADENSAVMREVKAGLASVHSKLLFDSTNFVRYQNLLKANATTRNEYDRIKLAYENSRNDHALQLSRIEKVRNDLHLALQNAENQWKIAQEESGNYQLRSEVDGMVFKIMKEPGELVRRSEAIAVLGKKGNYYLKLSIDELDIQRVKEGQEVAVKIDAYPDKVFHGKIRKVYPMVDTRLQSLRVDATIDEQLPGLFSGLAVEANIITRKKDKALVIPKTAILEGDSVVVKNESGEKKVKITRGIETLDEVEVVSGLAASDQLEIK
jgi:HlyD family secretion protein